VLLVCLFRVLFASGAILCNGVLRRPFAVPAIRETDSWRADCIFIIFFIIFFFNNTNTIFILVIFRRRWGCCCRFIAVSCSFCFRGDRFKRL
jgi:hypothetical protein